MSKVYDKPSARTFARPRVVVKAKDGYTKKRFVSQGESTKGGLYKAKNSRTKVLMPCDVCGKVLSCYRWQAANMEKGRWVQLHPAQACQNHEKKYPEAAVKVRMELQLRSQKIAKKKEEDNNNETMEEYVEEVSSIKDTSPFMQLEEGDSVEIKDTPFMQLEEGDPVESPVSSPTLTSQEPINWLRISIASWFQK